MYFLKNRHFKKIHSEYFMSSDVLLDRERALMNDMLSDKNTDQRIAAM